MSNSPLTDMFGMASGLLGNALGQPPRRTRTYDGAYSALAGQHAAMAQMGVDHALNNSAQRLADKYATMGLHDCRNYQWAKCGLGRGSFAAEYVTRPIDKPREDAEAEYCEFAMIPRENLYDKSDPFGVYA